MILDGKKFAAEIQAELKEKISHIKGRPPCLAVLLVGDNPASLIYVTRKIAACTEVGVRSLKKIFPAELTEDLLLHEIQTLNEDTAVDGILVQLPLPSHIDAHTIVTAISPEKDVDGLHPLNMGKLFFGDRKGFVPCTPLGCETLLERAEVEIAGKEAVVLGRSPLVGKPMAALLLHANATVTIAHSHTKHLEAICRRADILIAAVGKAKMVRGEMVKEGAVVIDVGINQIKDPTRKSGFRLVGDVAFDEVEKKAAFITPVPGGVGPMTIAMLMQNTLKSYTQTK